MVPWVPKSPCWVYSVTQQYTMGLLCSKRSARCWGSKMNGAISWEDTLELKL